MSKVMLIDNFDSFVHNLSDEFHAHGCEVMVYRANLATKTALEIIAQEKPDLLVMSPGPGTPPEARLCNELLAQAPKNLPIFGVCLGHQSMVEYFGGRVGPADEIVHGKSSIITHNGRGIFSGLSEQIHIARYHSLVALEMPACLTVTAQHNDMVMAIEHKERPVIGVQFHPESVLTTDGHLMIKNLLEQYL